MKNYELYKNTLNAEEYLNNLKAKNLLYQNDNKSKEENVGKNFYLDNINYKNASGVPNENLFRGNIRYNSATTSEMLKNSNLNRMDLNVLYNNDNTLEKVSADVGGFNDVNKRSEMHENYKNNFLLEKKYNNLSEINERENYLMKHAENPLNKNTTNNNPSFYSAMNNDNKITNVSDNPNGIYDENPAKTDLRANFIKTVINEATRNGGYKESSYQSENRQLYGPYNYHKNETEPNKGSIEVAHNKKPQVENLMNVHMNKNEDMEKNIRRGNYEDIKDVKNKCLDTFYNNFVKANGNLIMKEDSEANISKNVSNTNPHLGYGGGTRKRYNSSNAHMGKPEYEKMYNYFTDDTDPKLRYYKEANAPGGAGETSNTLALDHYLQLKRAEEERIAKQQMNNLNVNLKNRDNFGDNLGTNTNSNAINTKATGGVGPHIISNNINSGNEGKKEIRDFTGFDINELRKKHMHLNSLPPFNNDSGLENEKNFLNKKENYLEAESEAYNGNNAFTEKLKFPGFMANYEDLLPLDKNIKKKGTMKSIVCVCQASKQMARLQIHIEENLHMLETEKSLMKKRKENFEKKVEMLAEKEKEIERIHLQSKEKEMTIEKKKNEIEEKEKYVSAIKNKYDNAQKELLEKMNECITIENKCKSKLYEYDEKFGQFNKKIKEMEEREKEIEDEKRQMERKEKMLNSSKQELEEEKLALLKEKNDVSVWKKELETLEKEKKKVIENEYDNLRNKEEEIRRNERNVVMKEKELETRIDRYNDLIDELNKKKKEFEKEKMKLLDEMQEERLKLLNEKKQLQISLENEKNNLRIENENEKNMMKEELKNERLSLMENIEKEKKNAKEKLEKERSELHKTMEELREKMNEDNEKLKNAIEERYKENYENDRHRLEKKYGEEEQKLKVGYENKVNELNQKIERERDKLNEEKEKFEQQKQMYEEEFRERCDQYENNIKTKYDMLEEDKNKMKILIMKEQEELENYKKNVYLDIEEEKEKLYVQEKKLNLEKENLLVEKEQIEIELKNYKNFKEKEENDIKIRIINLSQQQEDLNKEKENVEKEKDELEKRRISLDEKEECLNNDKNQIEESRQIFDEQLEKIKKDKEELLNYDKDLKQREIHLIEKEKEYTKKEEEIRRKQETLNSFENELKEYSERLQNREKKLKEKKNELQKVKDQLVQFKNSIKQKETQLQMIEEREKELLDEQTLVQIDRNSLEAEKKQFFLLKEKQQKDTDFIQEQLKLLHEQLKNKEKALKEKENEVSLLNKLQDCRSKSGKGNIISLKNIDNPRILSANVSRGGSTTGAKNKVKVKVIGKNKFDLMKKRNRKKSINFNYNNLDINNSIQYIDSMINDNFKNKARLQYQNDNLELSDANFMEEKNPSERRYPPRASILMNNAIDSELLTDKIANLKIHSEKVGELGMQNNEDRNGQSKKLSNHMNAEEDNTKQHDSYETNPMNNTGNRNKRIMNNGMDNINNADGMQMFEIKGNKRDVINNAGNANDETNYSYTDEKTENRNFFRNTSPSEFPENGSYENAMDDNYEKNSLMPNGRPTYESVKKDTLNNRNDNYMYNAYPNNNSNNNNNKTQGFVSGEERDPRNAKIYAPSNYEHEVGRYDNSSNNNTMQNNKKSQHTNYEKEKSEFDLETDLNNPQSGKERISGKQSNDEYLSNKHRLHSMNTNYNIKNVPKNIKMGSSSFNETANMQDEPTVKYNEKREPKSYQEHSNILMAMNMNDLITSEVVDTRNNSCDKEVNNNERKDGYDGHTRAMRNKGNAINNKNNRGMPVKAHLLETGEENHYDYSDENLYYDNGNGGERDISKNNSMGRNANAGRDGNVDNYNITKKNMKSFKNEKITNTNNSNINETPLDAIDNLVNKNMQSINHMSSVMMYNSSSRNNLNGHIAGQKGKSSSSVDNSSGKGMKGFNPLGNNYKNMPPNPRNIKNNREDKLYNDEFLNKEGAVNVFLEEENSEKYYYQPNKNFINLVSEPVENTDTLDYRADAKEKNASDNNNLNHNNNNNNNKYFADSYDYNFNEGYEKDVKREEDGMQYIESNTNTMDNKLNHDRYAKVSYDSSRYGNNQTAKGGDRYDNENAYNNNTNLKMNTKKLGNIRMMQDSGYNSDSNVLMHHGYEKENMKKTGIMNPGKDNYENVNMPKTRNNSSIVHLNYMNSNVGQSNMPPFKNKNEEMMPEERQAHKMNEGMSVDKKNKNILPPGPRNRSLSRMNKLPPLSRNATINSYKNSQMNNKNNANTFDNENIPKKMQTKNVDANVNKNTNVTRMKMLSDNVQSSGHTNTGGNSIKGNVNNNNIIEQLDKTLLNKSIMLLNKSKKNVKNNEGSNSSILRHNSSNKNTGIHANSNLNSKQRYIYNAYNSESMDKPDINSNRNNKNDNYDSYKKKNTFGNNNALHMSSDIYDSTVI